MTKKICIHFTSLLKVGRAGNTAMCCLYYFLMWIWGFPTSTAGKESTCNMGDLGTIPRLGISSGEENGYPPQYSGLENSTDCIVHGVTKSQTWLSNFTKLTCGGSSSLPSFLWIFTHTLLAASFSGAVFHSSTSNSSTSKKITKQTTVNCIWILVPELATEGIQTNTKTGKTKKTMEGF